MSRFEPAPLSRRDLILVIISGVVALGVIITLVVVLIRSRSSQEPLGAEATITPVDIVTLAPTFSPSPSGPPTLTPTLAPTPTLEPYQYKVQAGDTLFAIIQIFGYRDISVVPEVIRLNNMANENDLQADRVLLIPRQTPTLGPTSTLAPTPLPGTTPTATVEVTAGPTMDFKGCSPDNRCASPDGKYWLHEVQSGETIAYIAWKYNTRLDAVLQANGLTEQSFIQPGQQIYVPILVTLTPTLTPTGGPGSTATPVPTLSPPSLLAPADGETIPRGDAVILQWVTTNSLSAGQYYMVIVRNMGTEQEHRATTHSNSYRLPDGLQPGLGQSAQFEWRAVVVSGADTTAQPVSGQGPAWTFTWGP